MGFILFLHISACILLVVTILMQAGKGGGLTETFASAESMFGTQTNKFMVRTSTILAVVFLATALILAVYGSKGQRSIMTNKTVVPQAPQKPAGNEPEVSIKVSAPQPVDPGQTPLADEKPAATPPAVNAAQ